MSDERRWTIVGFTTGEVTYSTADGPVPAVNERVEVCPVTELDRLRAQAEARDAHYAELVEAARGVGMNWKTGAPYGLDALDAALAKLEERG